jgi:hypothetical protein
MERVFRRTPSSEKAAIYGYKDLLRDSIRYIGKKASANVARMTSGGMSEGEVLELAMSGVGGGVAKLSKTPEATRGLMRKFMREGLHYDAFTEPLPGYGYHQWTLYGEGPAKGATFGTKTTSMKEMEGKIADLMRKFAKEPSKLSKLLKERSLIKTSAEDLDYLQNLRRKDPYLHSPGLKEELGKRELRGYEDLTFVEPRSQLSFAKGREDLLEILFPRKYVALPLDELLATKGLKAQDTPKEEIVKLAREAFAEGVDIIQGGRHWTAVNPKLKTRKFSK